jgi:hypothetical protein
MTFLWRHTVRKHVPIKVEIPSVQCSQIMKNKNFFSETLCYCLHMFIVGPWVLLGASQQALLTMYMYDLSSFNICGPDHMQVIFNNNWFVLEFRTGATSTVM